MKRISIDLGLNLTHDKDVIRSQYDILKPIILKEYNDYIDVYLDFSLGQFQLVILLEGI